MKQPQCVVAVLAAVLGCALTDESLVCPMADKPMSEVAQMFDFRLEVCVTDHLDLNETEALMQPPNEEEARVNLRKYCNTTSTIDQCFASMLPYAQACLDEHLLTAFKVNRDNWRAGVEAVCSDQGERVAMILGSWRQLFPRTKDNCGKALHSNSTEASDPSSSILGFYRNVKTYKQCVSDLFGEDEDSRVVVGLLNTFITDVLKEMKCVAADNQTVQRCEALENPVH